MGKMKRGSLPHHRVYTRLGPSKIHGVGVFAIRNIKKEQFLTMEITQKWYGLKKVKLINCQRQ